MAILAADPIKGNQVNPFAAMAFEFKTAGRSFKEQFAAVATLFNIFTLALRFGIHN